MDANFFYCSIYDRFIQKQPYACMRVCIYYLFHKMTNMLLFSMSSSGAMVEASSVYFQYVNERAVMLK